MQFYPSWTIQLKTLKLERSTRANDFKGTPKMFLFLLKLKKSNYTFLFYPNSLQFSSGQWSVIPDSLMKNWNLSVILTISSSSTLEISKMGI